MTAVEGGESSIKTLLQTSPPSYLTPSPHLSRHARSVSRHLYSSLFSSCPNPKPPLDNLLIDDNFDAEQIWCQIDLLSRPVISLLKKEVKKIERDPPEYSVLKNKKNELIEKDVETAATDDEVEDEEKEEAEEGEEEEDESEDGEEQEDMEEEEIQRDVDNKIEDEFFKVNELEKYLVKDEEREYGIINDGNGKKDDEDDEDDEDGNPLDLMYGDLDDGSDEDHGENARYEDFWEDNRKTGCKKKNNFGKKKSQLKRIDSNDEAEDDSDSEQEEDSDDEPKEPSSDDDEGDNVDANKNMILSTHEKEQLRIQSEIEKREKANLDPKAWTMQGEVTAAKRPRNSALEVDLDFEHNMKPPPVVTEEFTASIEDLIKQRIIEGKFDDAQKAPGLPSKAPKELKELDENKSKKGLAELYEEEYAQQTGLAAAPLSSLDVDKNEATKLFKKICLKLDALSHFHFAPKPVIEEMCIQSNVPALAMEEIAPVAVSDAAMLAPEEIFKGKGDVKEEAELTQEERKRRRANKKRKFKARKANSDKAKKARLNAAATQPNDLGAEES